LFGTASGTVLEDIASGGRKMLLSSSAMWLMRGLEKL